MEFSKVMEVPVDLSWKQTLPTADPVKEEEINEDEIEIEEEQPVEVEKDFHGNTEGNIKYSTVLVVRNIFEKLAKAAEESVGSNHGDSVDVVLQVAAIFASSGEAAALTQQKLSEGVPLTRKESLISNSKRISDQIWNPGKYI